MAQRVRITLAHLAFAVIYGYALMLAFCTKADMEKLPYLFPAPLVRAK